MFRIYIRNYLENGVNQPKEILMYEIPDLTYNNKNFIEEPRVKGEMGKSESFDFAMEPESPWYPKLRPNLTIFRVMYDRRVIFFGRLLDYSQDNDGRRSYHCEGALSFFLDSFQSPSKESKRKEISALEWMQTMIKQHNTQVGENLWKRIELGEVPGQYSTSEDGQQVKNVPNFKYGSDSWQETFSCFEQLLTDNGGYLRVRYENQNGEEMLYLDWFKDYFRSWNNTMTPIEIGKNLIDRSSKLNVDKLFTVLIPYGSKSGNDFHINNYCWPKAGHENVPYMKVPELLTEGVYSEEELANPYYPADVFRTAIDDFGIIYKVQKFENAKDPVELFNFAKDWIKNNYRASIISMDVKALDLHLVGEAANQYDVGDQVKIRYYDPEKRDIVTRMLCFMAIQYDLQNPDNNSYTLSIPDNPYNKKYGTKQNGGGGGGGSSPTDTKQDLDAESQKKLLEEINAFYLDLITDPKYAEKFIEPGSENNYSVPLGKMYKNMGMPGTPIMAPGAKLYIQQVDPIPQAQEGLFTYRRGSFDAFNASYGHFSRADIDSGRIAGLKVTNTGLQTEEGQAVIDGNGVNGAYVVVTVDGHRYKLKTDVTNPDMWALDE